MARASDSAEGAAFARTLSALKERGSNLLVVGTTYEEGHVAVCERLLGEPGADRRRLLVHTDGDCGAVPEDGVDETRVVEQRPLGTSPRSRDDHRTVPTGAIDDLERVTLEGLTSLAGRSSELAPGELRLCVDSLRPLFVEHSEVRVRQFVEQIARRISALDGMGHFHLPTTSSDRYVSSLTPVVDAVVEVRTHEGQPQQRWHVFEGTVDSGWLPL